MDTRFRGYDDVLCGDTVRYPYLMKTPATATHAIASTAFAA